MSRVVFISHRKEDNSCAGYIHDELERLHVKAYLDILEDDLLLKGEKLTKSFDHAENHSQTDAFYKNLCNMV